jgi:hypothetical protein
MVYRDGWGSGLQAARLSWPVFAAGVRVEVAQAAEAHPDFSERADVDWLVIDNKFIWPPTGPGPIEDDPAYPHSRNNYRIGDLSNLSSSLGRERQCVATMRR